MLPPVPSRSLALRLWGIELVLRPGGVLLFGGIAAALDLTFLPAALPGLPALSYHGAAVIITLLMIVHTLLHEGGHALAYRLQGIWPVRVTLRGSGGACAAIVYEDTPLRALLRALAGPAMTACVLTVALLAWRVAPLPSLWRLVAASLAVFTLCDLVFNTLPIHPRADGTFALRALLWLARRGEPDTLSVLYVWRPLVLAAALLAAWPLARAAGLPYTGPGTMMVVGWCALALCTVPPAALLWRAWRERDSRTAHVSQA